MNQSGGVIDAGQAPHPFVAGCRCVPSVGDVLRGRRRILFSQKTARIVMGQVCDNAAPIGDLGRLAQGVVIINRSATVGAGALDDVAEAVAHIARAQGAWSGTGSVCKGLNKIRVQAPRKNLISAFKFQRYFIYSAGNFGTKIFVRSSSDTSLVDAGGQHADHDSRRFRLDWIGYLRTLGHGWSSCTWHKS